MRYVLLTALPHTGGERALEPSTSTQSHQSPTWAIKGCMHCCSSPYHTFTHALQLCYQTPCPLWSQLRLLSASIREYLMQDLLHVNSSVRHPNVSDGLETRGLNIKLKLETWRTWSPSCLAASACVDHLQWMEEAIWLWPASTLQPSVKFSSRPLQVSGCWAVCSITFALLWIGWYASNLMALFGLPIILKLQTAFVTKLSN